MKKILFFIVAALFFANQLIAQSPFKKEFMAAMAAKNMTKAEEVLKAWLDADANDAELYTSYFNFYTRKSIEADSTKWDKKYIDGAIAYITDGITRFPTRFDMRLLKIYTYEQLKEYKLFTEEIIKMIDYSKKIDNQWKGEDFRLVPKANDMFYGAIDEFQGNLFAAEDSTLYGYIIQISDEMLKFYPEHVQSLLNLSTAYIMQKKYDASLKALLKAEKIQPQNAIILYNIAYVYGVTKDTANAKKYFELTVQNAGTEQMQLKQSAQKQLDSLNGKK